MNNTLLVLIGSQMLFSGGDLLGRHYMQKLGFHWTTFASLWFVAYVSLRSAATLGQLFVFTHFQLGKTMALFATINLVLANVLGYLVLGEVLPPFAYVGIMMAIAAFFVVAYAKA
jgi:drug/metabolite transporter (DMT)-like permease